MASRHLKNGVLSDILSRGRIAVSGAENSREIRAAVRREIADWWSVRGGRRPVPDHSVTVERNGSWFFCEIEINDSQVTWSGAGCDRDAGGAVRRALGNLSPKTGSGVPLGIDELAILKPSFAELL